MAGIFYRVVRSDPPTTEDFQPRRITRTNPFDPTTAGWRMAEGISVFATLAQARRIAKSFPDHGLLIAELSIRDDANVTVARTGRQRGHHTIWAEPRELRGCVTSVVRV